MFFRKREPKKHHPGLAITVAALSALGACTLFCATKDKCCEIAGTVKQWMHKPKSKCCEPFCDDAD